MKEHMVMLDVETLSIDSHQFQKPFGVKGERFKSIKIRKGILWRAESTLAARAPLSKHIQPMLKRIPELMQRVKDGRRLNRQPYFNVGVTYDSSTCTVDLPAACLTLMSQHEVGIRVSCYPTEFKKKRN